MTTTTDLTTWSGFRAWVRASFKEAHEFGADLLRFDYPNPDRKGGTVGIGIWRKDGPGDQSWLLLAVKVCPAARIPPMNALIANFDMPVGALRVIEDHFILGVDLPLAVLNETLVRDTLDAIAKEGDLVRRKMASSAEPPTAATYSHFAE